MSRFLKEIQLGLKKETHSKADIKCFVTYVQDLPNGKGISNKHFYVGKHVYLLFLFISYRAW